MKHGLEMEHRVLQLQMAVYHDTRSFIAISTTWETLFPVTRLCHTCVLVTSINHPQPLSPNQASPRLMVRHCQTFIWWLQPSAPAQTLVITIVTMCNGSFICKHFPMTRGPVVVMVMVLLMTWNPRHRCNGGHGIGIDSSQSWWCHCISRKEESSWVV